MLNADNGVLSAFHTESHVTASEGHAVNAVWIVLVLRSRIVFEYGDEAVALAFRDFFEQFLWETHFQQVLCRLGGKSADGLGMAVGISNVGLDVVNGCAVHQVGPGDLQ